MWDLNRCAGGLKDVYGRAPNAIELAVGFFNVLPSFPSRDHPFLCDSGTPPHLVAFYDHAKGYMEIFDNLDLTPGSRDFYSSIWRSTNLTFSIETSGK